MHKVWLKWNEGEGELGDSESLGEKVGKCAKGKKRQ